MKIWEVELKEKNTPCRTYREAPRIESPQVAAEDYKEAGEKAVKLCGFQAIVTKVELIAETWEE